MLSKFFVYLGKSDAVNIFKAINVFVIYRCYMLIIYIAMLHAIGIEF